MHARSNFSSPPPRPWGGCLQDIDQALKELPGWPANEEVVELEDNILQALEKEPHSPVEKRQRTASPAAVGVITSELD